MNLIYIVKFPKCFMPHFIGYKNHEQAVKICDFHGIDHKKSISVLYVEDDLNIISFEEKIWDKRI